MKEIEEIRYYKNEQGKSYRETAAITGYAFETVKKYSDQNDFNIQPKRRKKKTLKIAMYASLIDEWLKEDKKAKKKQTHTGVRVYNRLKDLFQDNLTVSSRSVREYVSKRKKHLNISDECYIPLTHPPGSAQADFGEAQFIENGIKYDGYYLCVSFPFSNAGFVQIFKSKNQECLLQGLKDIFEYIGFVPTEIWFDNDSTMVIKIKTEGKRILTQGFIHFKNHYDFKARFCNPNSGHEKGSVESKVRYLRKNLLVPIPEFKDIELFNKELLQKCTNDLNREHYLKDKTLLELFNEDKQEMLLLPNNQLEIFKLQKASVDKYGKSKI